MFVSMLGITVHEGDACDKPLLTNLIKSHSINVIVHLAARTSLTVSIDDPISLVHSNVECQFVILELLKDYKVCTVICINVQQSSFVILSGYQVALCFFF